MLSLIFLILLTQHLESTPQGDFVNSESYRFMVAILDHKAIVCSGTIVSDFFILTAAHCFKHGNDTSSITIAVSNQVLNYDHVKKVSQIIIHPRYANISRDFDLALVRLTESLEKDKQLKWLPAKLDYHGPQKLIANAMGWHPVAGISVNSTLKLRYVQVYVWNPNLCNSFEIWGLRAYYDFGPLISERMVCVSVSQGASGTCDLDDGGPLIIDNTIIAGVLSWRYDCITKEKPSVYINIPFMLPWIEKVMELSPKT